ncbi:MAG: oxidoreductase [Rhodospirillaceae bacterium]|nr:oxidoreductase [Rhodospirillaceae bacterium]
MADNRHPSRGGDTRQGVNRRWVLTSGASTAVAVPLVAMARTDDGRSAAAPGALGAAAAGKTTTARLTVNGRTHDVPVDPRTTLLDALRETMGLTGPKKGCDHGQCGACTVHIGGRPVLSCLTLALAVREPVTTIEGLAAGDGSLHPMQQAFVDHDAFQCGYCTPGQIMSAVGCVESGHAGDDAAVREYMSGNLCRCAAYPNIVAAIRQVDFETGRG